MRCEHSDVDSFGIGLFRDLSILFSDGIIQMKFNFIGCLTHVFAHRSDIFFQKGLDKPMQIEKIKNKN